MSAHGSYILQMECDRWPGCKIYQDFEGDTREECLKQAKRAGWVRGIGDDDDDFCGRCALLALTDSDGDGIEPGDDDPDRKP